MQDTDPDSHLDSQSLRKAYGEIFRNFNLHHIIPGSRKGQKFEFNLFPFLIKAHRAWHYIFLNLTIMEVWINLDSIYSSIFDTDDEKVQMVWLQDCRLESGKTSKVVADFDRNVLRLAEDGISTHRLRQKWFVCFGGTDLHQARMVMKMMMLVMVFGHRIANREELFDNGNIHELIERLPVAGPRSWAFENCFGSVDANPRRVKALTSKILEAYPHY